MYQGLAFLLLVLISIGCGQVSEAELRQGNPLPRFAQALIYQYVTNRPENVTHGNATFVPIPGVEDIYMKATFFVVVDRLARTNFSDIVTYLEIPGANSTLMRTTRKRYAQGGFVVGSWSAYITMDEGTNTGIYWDGGCQECSNEAQCIDNFCGLATATCGTQAINRVCEMKTYLAWLGSCQPEGSAAMCTSASLLPSTFRLMALFPAFEQAAGVNQQQTAGLFF